MKFKIIIAKSLWKTLENVEASDYLIMSSAERSFEAVLDQEKKRTMKKMCYLFTKKHGNEN